MDSLLLIFTFLLIILMALLIVIKSLKIQKLKREISSLKKELENKKCENLNKTITEDLNLQRETDQRKIKILEFLLKHETITNDEVEYLLKVSHSTAYRLLEALEQDKKILQIGNTGRHVYYILNRYKR